jgi:hypothetical protein
MASSRLRACHAGHGGMAGMPHCLPHCLPALLPAFTRCLPVFGVGGCCQGSNGPQAPVPAVLVGPQHCSAALLATATSIHPLLAPGSATPLRQSTTFLST